MIALLKKITPVEIVIIIGTALVLALITLYGIWAKAETVFYCKVFAKIIITSAVLHVVATHKDPGRRTLVALLALFTACMFLYSL